MKKYILILVAVIISNCGYAQKGTHAVGLNITGVLQSNEVYSGLKYQYSFTDKLRGEICFKHGITHRYADLPYCLNFRDLYEIFGDENYNYYYSYYHFDHTRVKSGDELQLNLQYSPFKMKRFQPYAILGLSFNKWWDKSEFDKRRELLKSEQRAQIKEIKDIYNNDEDTAIEKIEDISKEFMPKYQKAGYVNSLSVQLGLGLKIRLSYHWDLQAEIGAHTKFGAFMSYSIIYNFYK